MEITAYEWGESTAIFKGKLDRLENAIRELSESHLPSLSIMLGHTTRCTIMC